MGADTSNNFEEKGNNTPPLNFHRFKTLKTLGYKDNFTPDQIENFRKIDEALFNQIKNNPDEPLKVGNVLIPPEVLKQMTRTTGAATRDQMYDKALNGGSLDDVIKVMGDVKLQKALDSADYDGVSSLGVSSPGVSKPGVSPKPIGNVGAAENTALLTLGYNSKFSQERIGQLRKIDNDMFRHIEKNPNEPFKVGDVSIPPEVLDSVVKL